MTPPPIETVSVARKDGRFVAVVRRGGIEAAGADQDEQTALFAARGGCAQTIADERRRLPSLPPRNRQSV
ncbi:MAG: hypothetical protein M5U26_14290 [Planctomycetota bacterium]|nr:hypothetical protein [Planctomycetota bacterium]